VCEQKIEVEDVPSLRIGKELEAQGLGDLDLMFLFECCEL
jgi:hypothetical protein